jgi:lipoprotein-anchoring transpeptidase ErfK/SrfK
MVPLICQSANHLAAAPTRRISAMKKFRHLIWMVIAAGGLILSASQSQAQMRQPDVGDQPGLLPDEAVELDPQFRKTAVLYRTNEPPGTIIISTQDRHLYLVQGNGRALLRSVGYREHS